jgi:hypothetical protein
MKPDDVLLNGGTPTGGRVGTQQEEDGEGLERLTSPFTPHAPQEASEEEEEGIDLEGTRVADLDYAAKIGWETYPTTDSDRQTRSVVHSTPPQLGLLVVNHGASCKAQRLRHGLLCIRQPESPRRSRDFAFRSVTSAW